MTERELFILWMATSNNRLRRLIASHVDFRKWLRNLIAAGHIAAADEVMSA